MNSKIIFTYFCSWVSLRFIDWIFAHIIEINRLISLVGRVFANVPGDLGSIPSRFIPKTFKMVLDTSLLDTLNNMKYVSREEWSNLEKGAAPSPTPHCSC